jgi:UDP-glucose 4-epimerase
MGKTAPLAIFGTDYPTRDGTCVRDYVHVNDLAQAHALALKHLQGGGESRTYNLGNGHGYSVREVVECVRNETSLALEVVDSDRRAGDPHSLVASSDLIKRELGWSPEFSDLQSMVQHAWNWRKRHPDGY